jgi:oxygen-independent coproporphyrinogen-3 oxidase
MRVHAQFPEFGVYVHVPYCRERCSYCDFALTPVDEAPSRAFADSAIAEVLSFGERMIHDVDVGARFANRSPVSVYFGGGTPSMLDPADAARILGAIDRRFGLASVREVTLEANPEDVTAEKVAGWRAAGVNRISLGVQALDDRFLAALGRAHDAAAARRAIETCRAGGIENVCIDLIFGVPGMTVADWSRTLAGAIALAPSHVSAYGLTLERGTRLTRLVEDGTIELPIEDDQAEMYERTAEALGHAGLERYEISNFAAHDRQALHNNLYWRYQEWIGVGPSAHSFARIPGGGLRWWNGKNPFGYLRSLGAPHIAGHEIVTGRAAMGELVFTGLRLAEGVSEQAFEDVFAVSFESIFGATARRLVATGLARREGGRLALTERGFLVSDSIFRDLVEIAA